MKHHSVFGTLNKIYLVAILCLAFFLYVIPYGCGGGGGGDGSPGVGLLNIRGTLTTGSRIARVEVGRGDTPVVGVQVCARGGCSITDGSGNFAFGIEPFEGGDVLFTFEGPGVSDQIAYPLPAGDGTVTVDFYITSDGGAAPPTPEPTPGEPTPTPTPTPTDSGVSV